MTHIHTAMARQVRLFSTESPMMSWLVLLVTLLWQPRVLSCQPSSVKVVTGRECEGASGRYCICVHTIACAGVILDSPDSEETFRFAVDYVNRKNLMGTGITLKYVVNSTNIIDTFESIQYACLQAKDGVIAQVGMMSSTSTKAVGPISRGLHIPHIAAMATDPFLGRDGQYPYLVRMMAPDSVQSTALVHLVAHYGWTKMVILTSNTDYGLNGLVEFQVEAARRDWRVFGVLHFSAADDVNATAQLRVIEETGVRVILLNCLAVFGKQVLQQASQLGMTGPGWAWIVTDGITASDQLYEPAVGVPEYMVGLLGSRPSTGRGELYKDISKVWAKVPTSTKPVPSAYQGYLIDAVLTLAYAVKDMYADPRHQAVAEESIDCDNFPPAPWKFGHTLLKYIQAVKGDGVSGNIQFNSKAAPDHPSFDIVNLHAGGWSSVGRWNISGGLDLFSSSNVTFVGGQRTVTDYISSLANRSITVVAIVEPPFLMVKNADDLSGHFVQPSDVEGICIDLLAKLSEIIGFSYSMYLVADGQFGIKDKVSMQWNGMVKDLSDRKADLAAAPLTINYAREQDIDFTKPYLDLGMSFILKKPEPESMRPFKFMDPFSQELWVYLLLTAFVVGLYVSLLNKLSPYDHHGHFVYIDTDDKETLCKVDESESFQQTIRDFKEYRKFKKIKLHKTNELNFSNSIWFSVGSLLQQGGETYPRSLSGRVVAVLWWFGVVIIIATYTANLAAWLTASRSKTTISSIEDLGTQTSVEYGTVMASAPFQYIQDSEITLMQDMFNFMQNRKTLVKNSAAGIEKARKGDYAFIWDSAVLEYKVERKPCNTLQTVGRVFGKLGYGFGLQKSSPYREELSSHILQLREQGYMDDLKRKWYQQKGECHSGADDDSEQSERIAAAGGTLHIQHLAGVFIIIYGGLVLSLVALVLEWIVRCASCVDQNDPLSPKSFSESMRMRWQCMKNDMLEDWLPSCCGTTNNRVQNKESPKRATVTKPTFHPTNELTKEDKRQATVTKPTFSPTNELTKEEPRHATVTKPTSRPTNELAKEEPRQDTVTKQTSHPTNELTKEDPRQATLTKPTSHPTNELAKEDPRQATLTKPTSHPTNELAEDPWQATLTKPTSHPTNELTKEGKITKHNCSITDCLPSITLKQRKRHRKRAELSKAKRVQLVGYNPTSNSDHLYQHQEDAPDTMHFNGIHQIQKVQTEPTENRLLSAYSRDRLDQSLGASSVSCVADNDLERSNSPESTSFRGQPSIHPSNARYTLRTNSEDTFLERKGLQPTGSYRNGWKKSSTRAGDRVGFLPGRKVFLPSPASSSLTHLDIPKKRRVMFDIAAAISDQSVSTDILKPNSMVQ